jgi:hypothetical protein
MWESAAKAGLILGLISTAYMFINMWIAANPGFLGSILSLILWVAKFVGCILVLKVSMKKFAAASPEIENKDTFNFGMATALLSALVYSAASFANVAFISGDVIAEQFNLTMQQMSSMMDSNSMAMMDTYLQKLPQITFFSNLIYCTAFGTVLSFILSRNIPSRDPFANYKPDQQ